MASTDLRKELECSVCLNISTDPVTLKCGHNFCRDCIGRVLDTPAETGGYSCPECREEFQERPAVQENITLGHLVDNIQEAQPDQEKLCNIVENFQSTHPDQDIGISCTYCIHTPVPAVKSCLMCEASLCDNHLRVHSKSAEHVLCDPTTSLQSRKCSVHRELLKYYCAVDSTCICGSCILVGEHRGHQVEALDEASEMMKKKLRKGLPKLMTRSEMLKRTVQNLQEQRKKVQGKAAGERKRVIALFRDLRKKLKDLQQRVLDKIHGQAEQVSLSFLDVIQKLEKKKSKLSRKVRHIKKLCNTTDPVMVLQESDTGDLYDTEDGDDEDRERHENLLHDGGDVDVGGISHILHTGLSDIMSGVNVQKCTGTHVSPHSKTKGKVRVNAEPSRPQPQPSSMVQDPPHQAGGPNVGSVQQSSGGSVFADILLDVRTAGNRLHISEDGKTASWSDQSQNLPETPERFQNYPQVMSTRSFSSGRHHWEVDVGGSGDWIVGVCYPSIDRREGQSLIGGNKSWGLERWGWDNQYLLIHDRKKSQLHRSVPIASIRIDLDYEAGQILFHDPCDPSRPLHTYTTTFTEPLHAILYVGDGCVKISGGNPM